jgi:hypothetical protein
VFVGTNLRILTADERFRATATKWVASDKRHTVSLVCGTPEVLKKVTARGAADLRSSVADLVAMVKSLAPANRKRFHIWFHPEAISLSVAIRDGEDRESGLMVFSPRWADDTEPVNRPFCVVERNRHKSIFDKLMAGVTRMSMPHPSRLSLTDVAKIYRIV